MYTYNLDLYTFNSSSSSKTGWLKKKKPAYLWKD